MFKKLRKFVGYRQRSNYWSCSAFAQHIREACGYKKPHYATREEWVAWKSSSKKEHRFVYWLTEDFFDDVQNLLYYPYDFLCAIRYYFYNRVVSETHKMKSDLEPGQFHEMGTRLLHCAFTDLVRFVEVEKAHMNVVWDKEARKKYHRPWYHKIYPLRLTSWVCPEAGIEHLVWESSLTVEDYDHDNNKMVDTGVPSSQAEVAKEVLDLYYWWKNVRPNRPDPYDAVGYDALVKKIVDEQGDETDDFFVERGTPEQKQLKRELLIKGSELEASYSEEDTEMLIRLVKIKDSLWT